MNSRSNGKSFFNDLFKEKYADAINSLIPVKVISSRGIKHNVTVTYCRCSTTSHITNRFGDSADNYFIYQIGDKKVTRQEAKDHLELQSTKLAELL